MKKKNILTTLSLSVPLFILCNLVLNASTAEIIIDVGKNNATTFTPQIVTVNIGDKVTWRWHGIQYTVTEADSQGSCIKSTKLHYFDFTEKVNNKVQSFIVPANSPKQLFYFDQNNCAKGMQGVIKFNSVVSPSKQPSSLTTSKSPTNTHTVNSLYAESSSSSNVSLIIVLATVGFVLSLVLCCAGFMIYRGAKKQSMNNYGMRRVSETNAENNLPSMSPSHIEVIGENTFVRPTSSVAPNRSGLLVPPSLANPKSAVINIPPFDAPRPSEIVWQSRPNSSSSDFLTIPSRDPSPIPTRRISNLSPTSTRRISNRSPTPTRRISNRSPTPTRRISDLPPTPMRRISDLPPTPTRRISDLPPTLTRRVSDLPPTLTRRVSDLPPTPTRRISDLPPNGVPPYSYSLTQNVQGMNTTKDSRHDSGNSGQDVEISIRSPIGNTFRYSENHGTENGSNNVRIQSSMESLVPRIQVSPVLGHGDRREETTGEYEGGERLEFDPKVMRRLIARETIFQSDAN